VGDFLRLSEVLDKFRDEVPAREDIHEAKVGDSNKAPAQEEGGGAGFVKKKIGGPKERSF